jgi:hypothetical protein
MAKFTVVKQAPATLEKGEIVISQPDFMEQILANQKKAPKHKQTAINHLREVLSSIAEKYDHDMNVFKIRLLNYEGLAFSSHEDLSNIVVRILKNEYPAIFDKVVTYELNKRPANTKLVYYTGDFTTTTPFYNAGLDLIEEKDIESYMTGKPKKIVGKPAITKEEAEANGKSTE